MFAGGGKHDTAVPAAVNRLFLLKSETCCSMIMDAHLGQMDCGVYQINSREAWKFKATISRENIRVVLL